MATIQEGLIVEETMVTPPVHEPDCIRMGWSTGRWKPVIAGGISERLKNCSSREYSGFVGGKMLNLGNY